MRRIHRILALVLLAAGCDAAPPAGPSPVAAAAAPRFEVGDIHVYRFAWTVAAESTDSAVLPSDLPIRGGIDLSGQLAVRVAGSDVGGTYLAVSLRALERHAIVALGESLLADPSELLGREVLVLVPADGDARRLFVAPDAPPLLRHLMPGLLAHVDLRTPRDAAGWTATIPTGHGLAQVEYSRSPADANQLRRMIRRYVRVDSVLEHGSPEQAHSVGEGALEHDARGVPIRIDSDELLTLAESPETPAFRSRARFELARVAVERREPGVWELPDALQEIDLAAPPDGDAIERALAQRFAGTLTIGDVQLTIAGVGNGLLPHRGFTLAATGLLRGWPELAVELEDTFLAQTSRHARSLVMDLLSSAGTPEAQRSMLRLLERADVRADPAYPRYIQRLSFVRRPLPGVATFLLALHANSDSDEVRRASLYPIGSVCAHLRASDVVAAAALHRRLVDALAVADDEQARVAALAGLGNAGEVGDLDRVLALIGDESPEVRLEVASALRFMGDPAATAALLKLLADPARIVASEALVVLDTYVLTEVAPLRAAIEAGAYHSEIAGQLVAVLRRRQQTDPEARAGLDILARATTDLEVRRRSEPLLGAAPV